MVYEKTFTVKEGRQVKIIIRGYYCELNIKIQPSIDVFIKETGSTSFSRPVGLKLPNQGMFEGFDQKVVREKIVANTGISMHELNIAVKEFEEISLSSVLW